MKITGRCLSFVLIQSLCFIAGWQGLKTDIHGDPLPEGAICRLGSMRMRSHGPSLDLRFSTDGKYLVSSDRAPNGIRIIDVATGADLEPVKIVDEPVQIQSERPITLRRNREFEVGRDSRLVALNRGFLGRSFSPDGTTVARWAQKFDRAGKQIGRGSLQLWDTKNGKLKQEILTNVYLGRTSVAMSPNARFVVAKGDKQVILFDLEQKSQRVLLSVEGNAAPYFRISPDSKKIAVGDFYEGVTRILNPVTGKEDFALPKEFGLRSVMFLPDGRIAQAGEAGQVTIHSADGKEVLKTIPVGGNVFSFAVSPDSKLIATAAGLFRQHQIRLFEIETDRELHVISRHEQQIDQLMFSADGQRIVSGSVDKTVRIWDTTTGRHMAAFGTNSPTDDRGQQRANAISPDGKTLAIVDGKKRNQRRHDDEIVFCDAVTAKEIRRFPAPEGHVYALKFTHDGKSLVTLSEDLKIADEATDIQYHYRSIHVLDLKTGAVTKHIGRIEPRCATRLTLSRNGKLAATMTHSPSEAAAPRVQIFSLESDERVRVLEGSALAFSPTKDQCATINERGHIQTWEMNTWKPLREFDGGYTFRSLTISPDGKYIAAAGATPSTTGINVFEIATGKTVWHTKNIDWGLRAIAFAPDGKSLACVHNNINAVVWKLETRVETR